MDSVRCAVIDSAELSVSCETGSSAVKNEQTSINLGVEMRSEAIRQEACQLGLAEKLLLVADL